MRANKLMIKKIPLWNERKSELVESDITQVNWENKFKQNGQKCKELVEQIAAELKVANKNESK
jgi:hypothetical protein